MGILKALLTNEAADLSDDNGDTQTDEGFVMFFIGCEIAHVA